MELTRTTDIGTITINDITFANVVRDGVKLLGSKVFLSSPTGKILGGIDKKVSLNELTQNISLVLADNVISITVYIVASFGASISYVTDFLLNYMEKQLALMVPEYGLHIELKVTGVRSRQVAPRDLTYTRDSAAGK